MAVGHRRTAPFAFYTPSSLLCKIASKMEGENVMADRVIFVCILVLAGVYFYSTEQLPTLQIGDPLGPKAFPRLLGVVRIISAILLFFEMRGASKKRASAPAKAAESAPAERSTYHVVAGVTVWTFLYFLVFERLGYVIATTIYLIALMAFFHRGKWITNVVTSVLFCGISYWLFGILGVNLARGILPF
mgnify:CR=1 FL=1